MTHCAVGAIVGAMAPTRGVAVLAGLVSHAALDAVPHSDYSRASQGVIDVVAACLVAASFALAAPGHDAVWGAAAAAIPDIEVAAAYLFPRAYAPGGRLRLVFPSHSGLVPHGRTRFPEGALVQVLAVACGLLALAIRSVL